MTSCSQCGTKVSTDAAFCQECGNSLGADRSHDHSEGTSSTAQSQDTQSSSPSRGHPRHRQEQKQGQTQGQSAALLGGWGPTRLGAIGGAIVVVISLLLPWVTAIEGPISWNGMATVFGPPFLAGAIIAIVAGAVTWGGGWGRLSMLLTLLAGGGIVYLSLSMMSILSSTVTLGTVSVNGREVPLGAVEAGFGVTIAVAGGAIIALLSLVGFVSSFTSSSG